MAGHGPESDQAPTVLIVDDHQLFSDGLVHLVSQHRFAVVGTARTLREAARAAKEHQPDIVLLDYLLPDADGVEALPTLHHVAPHAKLLVVTALNDDETLARALDAGCAGFVTKDRAADDLIEAMQTLARGEAAIGPQHVARALAYLRQRPSSAATLTRRELEVLTLLADGLSNADIANRLAISANTVRNHVQSILAKLGARSRLEAVAIATRQRLLSAGLSSP